MSPDDLERLARFAGYAGVADDDEAGITSSAAARSTFTQRLKSPDAPEPKAPTTALTVASPASTTARVAVTTYVNGALRTAQGLIGVRGATA